MLRNWRALPENERRRMAMKIEAMAIPHRADVIPDTRLGHLAVAKPSAPKVKRAR